MKKRILIFSIALASIVLLGIIGWRLVEMKKTVSIGSIVLGDLPGSYCPEKAWVVVKPIGGGGAILDKSMTVVGCRTIALNGVATTDRQTYEIVVKLPGALAFNVDAVLPLSEDITYFPQLGDANNDNIIDKADEDLILASLSKSSSDSREAKDADIDEDGEVTVLDLSLVRLHQSVGVHRDDNKTWGI